MIDHGEMLITPDEFARRLSEAGNEVWAVENHIVVGDASKVLARLPDGCVDLIHTSPPYNIDKAYRGNHGDRRDLERYLDFLRVVTCHIKRVLKPNGSLFWQTGYTQMENGIQGEILPIDILSYEFLREGPNALVMWDRIIWRYFGGMAFKRKFTNRHETILWLVKPFEGQASPCFDVDSIRERSRELDKRNNFWGRNPGNVWEVDRVAYGSAEQSSHIAVYPEEVTEKIIRASSKVNDLVLDPFSGSGTTPKVARSLGRRWIGIEISREYAEESVQRIGFQQPNELHSLASAVIKLKAFGGRRGSLSVEEVASRLSAWAKSTDISPSRASFEGALSQVFHSPNGRNAKPEVWESFERIVEGQGDDPVVEVDRLLARDYKNRQKQNGVFRYRTALELLETLVLRVMDDTESVRRFVREIAANEPSSYSVGEHYIRLDQVERRLKLVDGELAATPPWLEKVVGSDLEPANVVKVGDGDYREDGYQPHLPLQGVRDHVEET